MDLLAQPAVRVFASGIPIPGAEAMLMLIFPYRHAHVAVEPRRPEDYAAVGASPQGGRSLPDERIERLRRALLNDLENIPPFFGVGLIYALSGPSLGMARLLIGGFALSRIAHTIFYVRGLQPHRSVAFMLGMTFLPWMLVLALWSVPERPRVATAGAPAAIGPYVQARVEGGRVYCSGRSRSIPRPGSWSRAASPSRRGGYRQPDGGPGSRRRGPRQRGEDHRLPGRHGRLATMNEVYAVYFAEPYPARSTVAAAGPAARARVEIEAIAVLPADLRPGGERNPGLTRRIRTVTRVGFRPGDSPGQGSRRRSPWRAFKSAWKTLPGRPQREPRQQQDQARLAAEPSDGPCDHRGHGAP